jgi:acetyl esterase
MAKQSQLAATLDDSARSLLAGLESSGGAPLESLTPQGARAFFAAGRDHFAAPVETVAQVRDFVIPLAGRNLEARLYCPAEAQAREIGPVVLYFHGGGWVLGDLESQDPLCRRLANASGVRFISVNYRHAPEHPFPAAVHDALEAFEWIMSKAREFGIDPALIVVAGESAGGTLATVVAQRQRHRIAGQVLFYPVTDLTREHPDEEPFGESYFVTASMMRWFIDLYLRNALATDPQASPLLATDFVGMPPTYMLLCGCDPLFAEGKDYAFKLKAAGSEVAVNSYPGQIHAFLTMDLLIPEATRAINESAAWIAARLGVS